MPIADRWKHLARTGTVIPCRSMRLLAADHEPPVVVGVGRLTVLSAHSIGYEVRGVPSDARLALNALNRLNGDPYNGLLRQRLEVVTDDEVTIMGGWTIPKVLLPDLGSEWTFSGQIDGLTVDEPSQTTLGTEVTFLLPREHFVRVMLRRFFPSPEEKGAAVNHCISVLGTEITFTLDDAADMLTVAAPKSEILPLTFTENWLGEPLRVMFGQLIYPRFIARALPDRTMISIRPSPDWRKESEACALWHGHNSLTDKDGFWQTYARLLAYVASSRDEQGQPNFEANNLTALYVEVIQAARGTRWVWALTVASAVEGLVRLIVPRATRRTEVDADAIERLRTHIDAWSGEPRLKEIANAAVSRELNTSSVQALRQFRDAGSITSDQLKAWNKVRNQVMHGVLVSPYSSAEDDKLLLDLAGLLHALTRRLIDGVRPAC